MGKNFANTKVITETNHPYSFEFVNSDFKCAKLFYLFSTALPSKYPHLTIIILSSDVYYVLGWLSSKHFICIYLVFVPQNHLEIYYSCLHLTDEKTEVE